MESSCDPYYCLDFGLIASCLHGSGHCRKREPRCTRPIHRHTSCPYGIQLHVIDVSQWQDLMIAVSIWICMHTASLCEATCQCCCQVLCILVPFYVFGTVLLDRSDLVFGAVMADSAGRGCEPKCARSEWRSGHPRSNPRRRWESFVHERKGIDSKRGEPPSGPNVRNSHSFPAASDRDPLARPP